MNFIANSVCVNAYIVEAWIQLIYDVGDTPYINVDVSKTEREYYIPEEHLAGNNITINVSHDAVTDFYLDREKGMLFFNARFGQDEIDLVIPCEAIKTVFSKESGAGSMIADNLLYYKGSAEHTRKTERHLKLVQ